MYRKSLRIFWIGLFLVLFSSYLAAFLLDKITGKNSLQINNIRMEHSGDSAGRGNNIYVHFQVTNRTHDRLTILLQPVILETYHRRRSRSTSPRFRKVVKGRSQEFTLEPAETRVCRTSVVMSRGGDAYRDLLDEAAFLREYGRLPYREAYINITKVKRAG